MATPDPLSDKQPWEAVLRPHRSLPPAGFAVLMGLLAAMSFVSGVIFVRIGAWPVCGFFGLDVGLVYLAFRLNYRSARMAEMLRLDDTEFTVERIGVRGDRRCWRLPSFWLRVELIEGSDGGNRLQVTTHGKVLPIGGFLSPEERRALAAELEAALRRQKVVVG
jgi:uncharacterized membrane protein